MPPICELKHPTTTAYELYSTEFELSMFSTRNTIYTCTDPSLHLMGDALPRIFFFQSIFSVVSSGSALAVQIAIPLSIPGRTEDRFTAHVLFVSSPAISNFLAPISRCPLLPYPVDPLLPLADSFFVVLRAAFNLLPNISVATLSSPCSTVSPLEPLTVLKGSTHLRAPPQSRLLL